MNNRYGSLGKRVRREHRRAGIEGGGWDRGREGSWDKGKAGIEGGRGNKWKAGIQGGGRAGKERTAGMGGGTWERREARDRGSGGLEKKGKLG